MRITTHINRGKELSDGSHPIRIAIHRGNERQVLYLKGHSIHSHNWNPVSGRPYTTKKECPKGYSVSDHATAVNAAIGDAIEKAEAVCKLYPDEPLSKIKDLIKDKIRPAETVTKFARPAESFYEYLTNKADTFTGVNRFGYAARFSVVAGKLKDYLKKSDESKSDIRFTDITEENMQGFIKYLMKENQSSTARGAIKLIKTAYFKAPKEVKASSGNPFENLTYGDKDNERTTRLKWLKIEHIEAIMNLELTGFRALARDVFCFQFYANGDRVRDSILLHRRDINDGYYHFKQTKTGKWKKVKLPAKALEIIDKYSTKGHIFFPELDNIKNPKEMYNRCSGITTQINADLKIIGELAEIPFPISSHMARHSFASYIYLKTKDIELTRKALGHSNIAQTAVYLEKLGATDTADKIASIWE
jgi:integrase/recombinase XerD